MEVLLLTHVYNFSVPFDIRAEYIMAQEEEEFWEAWTTVFKHTCVLYYVSYVFLMEVLMQDQIGD